MYIIPAIDMIDGKCVRLHKGDYGTSRIYNEDPVQVAAAFEDMGVKRLHLVDLDAAKGMRTNRDRIKAIRKEFKGLIEVGGGIRSDEDIKELLDCGVDRLIVGTILARNPDQVAKWIAFYGPFFIGGIDALNGEVKVAGWEEGSSFQDSDLAKKSAEMGICSIIYTNIAKDGTLSGPDLESTNRIAEVSGLPVILSGGISSREDFENVCQNGNTGVRGIITGKAFYEGRFDLENVIESFQKEEEEVLW